MILYWHKKENNKKLLLIFNGWGCDYNIISGLDKKDYDILVVYNYTILEPEKLECTGNYSKVDIIAWSFGVIIADICLNKIYNLDKLIAVNGTLQPVDNKKGIPETIFQKTIEGFDDLTKKKFFIRMMGGTTRYNKYSKYLPERCTEDQLSELKALGIIANRKYNRCNKAWSHSIIAKSDRIFPFDNLQRAWPENAYPIEGDHFLEFQHIADQFI